MAAAVFGIRHGLAAVGLRASWLVLIAQVLGGAAVFVASALVIARQATRDLLEMIRSRRRRPTPPLPVPAGPSPAPGV